MSKEPVPFGWKPVTLADTEPRITSWHQTPTGEVRHNLSVQEIVKTVTSGEGRIWVDVDSQFGTAWLALAETIGFHPLTIEDTLSPNSRVKIEEYEGYLFVVIRDAHFNSGTPDPYDFDTRNIYLFIGKSYLVTVHERPSHATAVLDERLAHGPELFDRGVDYLAYAVLDTLVDSYFPMLDEIDTFADELETDIFAQQKGTEALESIFALKRTLLALRRHHAPMREILSTMANRPTQYLQPATQVYFRDVYDHVVRQVESIETYRDLLTGALEIHFSVISNRTNEIVKALTILGTFLLPATWIASVYGMNFEWMPFLHNHYGFWIVVGAMFGVSAFLFWYLKSKRWL
jgi:magnesium transporter